MRSPCCAAQISQSPNAVPGSTEDAIVLRGFGCDIGARIRRAGSQFGKSYRTPRRDSNLKSKNLNESGLVNLNIINGEGFGSSGKIRTRHLRANRQRGLPPGGQGEEGGPPPANPRKRPTPAN